MCGRYVTPNQAAIERHYHLGRGQNNPYPADSSYPQDSYCAARYNVTPQQGNPAAYVPVIRHGADGKPELVTMQWWLLPYWSKEPRVKFSTFNARTDKVSSAASYRVPFRKRCCLIPAIGWFEWQATPSGKIKWWLHKPDRGIVSLAGLWDRWHRGDEVIESCTIIVGEANQTMRHVYDRMPVIIQPQDEAFWLDSGIDSVPALLTPPAEDMITAHRVRSDKRRCHLELTLKNTKYLILNILFYLQPETAVATARPAAACCVADANKWNCW
jgi:putative SOS response-associated peptidase YedK